MATFTIELYWPGVQPALVEELSERARVMARQLGPRRLCYIGCTFTPSDEICVLRLEGPDRMAVSELVDELGIVGARVSEVVEFGPSQPASVAGAGEPRGADQQNGRA